MLRTGVLARGFACIQTARNSSLLVGRGLLTRACYDGPSQVSRELLQNLQRVILDLVLIVLASLVGSDGGRALFLDCFAIRRPHSVSHLAMLFCPFTIFQR